MSAGTICPVLAGPTAVGKTGLICRLAAEFPVEVISLDSRQIYHGLRIGTAQPTEEEQAACLHHLVDFLPPTGTWSAQAFREAFIESFREIRSRGHVPLLVGGAGLYLDAVGEAAHAAEVYLNDGTGAFGANEIGFPLTTVWGDLDGDGDVDVLVKENGVGYAVHLNDGIGNFYQHWNHPDERAMNLGDLVLGDLDNDGDLDAVVTNGHFQSTSYPAMVFINDAGG